MGVTQMVDIQPITRNEALEHAADLLKNKYGIEAVKLDNDDILDILNLLQFIGKIRQKND